MGWFIIWLLSKRTAAPLPELVASGSLSILLFSLLLDDDQQEMENPYSFGVVLGALGYIVVVGVPTIA